MRQNAKRKARNDRYRSKYREVRVAFERAIKGSDAKQGAEILPKLYSIIDTLQKKNIIHKNNAARKKSRFNAMLKDIAGSKASKKKA